MGTRTRLAASLLLASLACAAQNTQPRAYSNAPVGVSFVIASYANASGGYEAE